MRTWMCVTYAERSSVMIHDPYSDDVHEETFGHQKQLDLRGGDIACLTTYSVDERLQNQQNRIRKLVPDGTISARNIQN